MTKFRPCIDLHSGKVKQIVGGTLSSEAAELRTNFVSELSAGHFARLYRDNALNGAHMIMLGPGNDEAALEALKSWPNGLQVGGGINPANAKQWIDAGAEKVIVTSCLFPSARFSQQSVEDVFAAVEAKRHRLVIDLSCRRQDQHWIVAMNKWQTLTDTEVDESLIKKLEPYCSEFLIHAADNEGLQSGIDSDLVRCLGQWCSVPVTYAGGGRSLEDLDLVQQLSNGKVDLTIGSALDIFGGTSVTLQDCIMWNSTKGGTVA